MVSVEQAMEALGVRPGADLGQVRAAFRRRILELHPDVSGDTSAAGQAAARDVVHAYRRLRQEFALGGVVAPVEAVDAEPVESTEADLDDSSVNARLLRVVVAAMVAFVAISSTAFFLIAFAQSGR